MTHSESKIQNPKLSLPRYPRYKDSGVEWLGEVPEHWEIAPFQGLFEMSPEKNGKSIVGGMLSISGYRGVEPKRYESDSQKRTQDQLADYRVVRQGQLAVNTMWLNYAGLGVSDHEGHMSPAYRAYSIRPKLNRRYAHHLLRSSLYVEAYTGLMQGIRPNSMQIKNEDFKKIPVLIPPKPEQDRIVAFLDQKTAEIDALIAKKQRQIELLDEQKAILINRAVTRGIVNAEFGMRNEELSSSSHSTFTTHNSKFSPSGIEWIGDIPEHWVTAPMYSRCDVRLGKMLDAAKIKGKHLQPYLRNTDVQWFEINSLDLPLMDFRPEEYERYSVQRGDLVVCEGGEPGRAALWDSDEPCFFQKALHRVRPLKGDDPKFLLYLFRNAVTMSAFSGVDKATIAHLTGEQLKRFRFAFPPVSEQAGIAAYLTEAQMRFSETTQRIVSHIVSLKTLRSTLIAHAVTGRIKV